MTPEDHIDAVLQRLAGGRVFPDVAPLGTSTPYITYQAVGGAPINFLTGERPAKQTHRMQVNCWADSRAEASELGMLIEDAMRSATHLQVEVLTVRAANYDEETNCRGTIQDFSIFC